MAQLENHEVVINLKLLKLLRVYHIFNSNSLRIFDCNIYRLSCIICIFVVLCLMIFATLGLFLKLDDIVNELDLFLIIIGYIIGYATLLKMCMFMYRTNNVCNIFNITRLNFLISNQCSKNINILYVYRNRIKQITNTIFTIQFLGSIQWFIFPLLINSLTNYENTNHRKLNIFNFRFPVTLYTFNQYYILFYAIEMTVMIFFNYILIALDVFIISLCITIIAQYEVLATSFKIFGHKDEQLTEAKDYNSSIHIYCNSCSSITNHYQEFKSIVYDQIQLYLEEKKFYSIVRHVVLMEIALVSIFLTFMTYMLILICMSTELLSIMNVIKFGSGTIWSIYHLFLYCYLFHNINDKKGSINFAIYSCNWMDMDLRFKKLILLSIQMNNANQLKLKASQKEIINLQLFANVIQMSYNIVSVMVKRLNKKS